MKIAFFEVEDWEKELIRELIKRELSSEAFEEISFFDFPLLPENAEEYKKFEVISVFVHSFLTRESLKKLENLKMIATRSAGYDHIDINFCKERGIRVYRVPDYGANVVAEHAFALLFTALRKIPDSLSKTEKGEFSYRGLTGLELKGKVLGVIGTGKIGRHMIKFAKAFEMKVLAYDVKPDENFAQTLGFEYTSLERIFSESDVISFHVPLLPSTFHLFNRDVLPHLKRGVIIINTSRGEIIESEALIEGLEKGIISFACLDVIEGERDYLKFKKLVEKGKIPQNLDLKKISLNYYLFSHPRVLVTPHNAFNTKESRERILKTTFTNIQDFLMGRKTKNLVV